MIFAAVDPGLTGAIALFHGDGKLLAIFDMPVAEAKVNGKTKNHLLLSSVATSLTALGHLDHVVIEEVSAMPGQGVTSMFRFGYVAGAIAGVAAGLGIPVTLVRPQLWQKIAQVKSGPDAGRLRASQLFPGQSKYFVRKMDHNRADAALIGYAFIKNGLSFSA
jgi:crossover junction endodeoxyribonuclease RuvC